MNRRIKGALIAGAAALMMNFGTAALAQDNGNHSPGTVFTNSAGQKAGQKAGTA